MTILRWSNEYMAITAYSSHCLPLDAVFNFDFDQTPVCKDGIPAVSECTTQPSGGLNVC